TCSDDFHSVGSSKTRAVLLSHKIKFEYIDDASVEEPTPSSNSQSNTPFHIASTLMHTIGSGGGGTGSQPSTPRQSHINTNTSFSFLLPVASAASLRDRAVSDTSSFSLASPQAYSKRSRISQPPPVP